MSDGNFTSMFVKTIKYKAFIVPSHNILNYK